MEDVVVTADEVVVMVVELLVLNNALKRRLVPNDVPSFAVAVK